MMTVITETSSAPSSTKSGRGNRIFLKRGSGGRKWGLKLKHPITHHSLLCERNWKPFDAFLYSHFPPPPPLRGGGAFFLGGGSGGPKKKKNTPPPPFVGAGTLSCAGENRVQLNEKVHPHSPLGGRGEEKKD